MQLLHPRGAALRFKGRSQKLSSPPSRAAASRRTYSPNLLPQVGGDTRIWSDLPPLILFLLCSII